MATTDPKFAAKTTSIAPLTRQAESFSERTFAKPSFKMGRQVVAKFDFPKSRAISEIGPSYTAGQQQPQQEAENA